MNAEGLTSWPARPGCRRKEEPEDDFDAIPASWMAATADRANRLRTRRPKQIHNTNQELDTDWQNGTRGSPVRRDTGTSRGRSTSEAWRRNSTETRPLAQEAKNATALTRCGVSTSNKRLPPAAAGQRAGTVRAECHGVHLFGVSLKSCRFTARPQIPDGRHSAAPDGE